MSDMLLLQVSAADPYFGASQAAAIGQQALIADMLQDATAAAKVPSPGPPHFLPLPVCCLLRALPCSCMCAASLPGQNTCVIV